METLRPAEPNFSMHQFSRRFGDIVIHFAILKMKDNFFLWIGTGRATIGNLSVAMATGFGKTSTSTSLLGDPTDLTSSSLASKLSQKTGCQVFVSYNVSSVDSAVVNFVHETVVEEFAVHPEKFK
ncbi:proteasome assembly chaperone 4-like [Ornithodoros turicata]|uniref:proteasome assembly chaperone 4-like n=1 Tax=Ornithodoros turicata TaxID=34597 RepID=UPI00313864B3